MTPEIDTQTSAIEDILGRPLHDLRISVTDRCTFRCTYCMPKEIFGPGFQFLKRHEVLSFEEIERLARVFAGLGVTKIRLTGGEPLLRRNADQLIARLAAIDGIGDLTMTTNGSLLRQRAQLLADAGLSVVAARSYSLYGGSVLLLATRAGAGQEQERAAVEALEARFA